jgi:NAD(P)-dependent dehydrogenase (short-subunit alcohol dehydrogenase family)
MTDKKVWLITGAGRGMGVDIAKAALAAGHAVVASGRNPERVSAALGSAAKRRANPRSRRSLDSVLSAVMC